MDACNAPRKGPVPTLHGPPAGADLEKAAAGEVDTNETKLPRAGPAGIPGQLGRELHGVLGLGLQRARDRLGPVSTVLQTHHNTSPLPTPLEPSQPCPQALPILEPPPTEPSPARLHLHPNFPRS